MAKLMTADYTKWLTVLEAVSKRKPNECNLEWNWLMSQIGLAPIYFLAVHKAIQQGRWRKAKNPGAYIKTVAKREALKMGLLTESFQDFVLMNGSSVNGKQMSPEAQLDFLYYQQVRTDPVKGIDGVWRSGPGWERDDNDPRNEYISYREFLASAVPTAFSTFVNPSKTTQRVIDQINKSNNEFHIYLHPRKKLNWKKWASAAGFDKWEKQVLQYKLTDTSRDRAIMSQSNETSRKALQAAWKRVDRTGMERLRNAAKKNMPADVPE